MNGDDRPDEEEVEEDEVYEDVDGPGLADDDLSFLDLLAKAERDADELLGEQAAQEGGLVARALQEQKNVLEALRSADDELAHMDDEAGSENVRRDMAEIARSRKIDEDDPLWVLVDLYVMLHERTGVRLRKLVKAALEVGGGRVRMDGRILELLPVLTEASQKMEGAGQLLQQDLASLHKMLTNHRADAMTFIDGMRDVFRTFTTVAQGVSREARQSRWERIAERVLIPFLALVLGFLFGRMMH